MQLRLMDSLVILQPLLLLKKCQFQWLFGLRCICLHLLEHWDHGFESHSRHRHMYAFFCVVLSCTCRGLSKCLNGFMFQKLILNWNRTEDLICETIVGETESGVK